MTEPTWATRERLILDAIVDAEETGHDPNVAAYDATDLPRDVVMRCIQRLYDDGFVEARFNYGDDMLKSAHVTRALPKALRELGIWPKAASPLEEKRQRRLVFMDRIYSRSDGNPRERIQVRALGAELGWEVDDAFDVAMYLRDEGLVSFPTMGSVAITHTGVVEMEQALDEPNSPTPHFPPINIINVHGNVTGSQLQAGAVDSTQERS